MLLLEQKTLVDTDVEAEPALEAIPVLIRVPSLSQAAGVRRRVPARRRRLRREFRMAGSTLLMATPLAWALIMLGGRESEPMAGVPARLIGIECLGTPVVVADEVPRVRAMPGAGSTASNPETAAMIVPASARGRRSPVVLPGYLLPVDGTEEPAHAGG